MTATLIEPDVEELVPAPLASPGRDWDRPEPAPPPGDDGEDQGSEPGPGDGDDGGKGDDTTKDDVDKTAHDWD